VLDAKGLSLSGFIPSTYRYKPKPLTDRQQQLHGRIQTLYWAHPRYGYRCIRRLLTKEGWTIRRKQIQRIRRCQGLKVRLKPKKIPRRGTSTAWPTQATHRHHVWTWDFIFDRTDNGGTIKIESYHGYRSVIFLKGFFSRQRRRDILPKSAIAPCGWSLITRASMDPRWEAIRSIASKIGCTGETLRTWMRKSKVDTGRRADVPTEERIRFKG